MAAAEEKHFHVLSKKGEHSYDVLEDINPSMKCPVCYSVAYPPIMHRGCKQLYCQGCWNKLEKCATCRSTLMTNITDFPALMMDLINAVSVECSICKLNLTIGDIESHSKSCLSCKWKCGFHGARAEVSHHEDKCDKRKVNCPLCSWTGTPGTADDYNIHRCQVAEFIGQISGKKHPRLEEDEFVFPSAIDVDDE